jgi:hypothetical protein
MIIRASLSQLKQQCRIIHAPQQKYQRASIISAQHPCAVPVTAHRNQPRYSRDTAMPRFWIALLLATSTTFAQPTGLTPGPVKLESAEALAFGPDGILFVGDSAAGAVYALDSNDRTANPNAPAVQITSLEEKLAALLGTTPADLRLSDLKVNPLSKNIYLAVSRGRGTGAIPVILKIDGNGTITELATTNIPHARVTLPGLPATPRGRRTSRAMVITDLQYVNGQLIIAGLSNEDFSSTLRVVPYPFTKADKGTSVEIYHTSHFTYETSSPVRTMVPYTHNGTQYLLAAYTCTPLVKLRLGDLKDGAHIQGETLVELGRHSSPLDMIHYQKQGQDYLLVANTSRGVLKLTLEDLDQYEPVNPEGGDSSQIPMKRIVGLKGVVQLDSYDATRALMLIDDNGRFELKTVPLP